MGAMAMSPRRAAAGSVIAAVLLATALGAAQDQPANNLADVHEQLKADKRANVAKYLDLTDTEARAFWPVYEAYQGDLAAIDRRLVALLQSYAADFRSASFTDGRAKALLDEWIALDSDDAGRRAAYASRVLKVLPPRKAARYLEIESEYRILVRYDLAVTVPLVR